MWAPSPIFCESSSEMIKCLLVWRVDNLNKAKNLINDKLVQEQQDSGYETESGRSL